MYFSYDFLFPLQESADYVELSAPIFQGAFDITMTYRQDSDVILDYGCLTNKSTNKPIESESILNYDKNIHVVNLDQYGIAELKERKKDIAWLVSHCNTESRREGYVQEMKKSKQLQIDVFGKCGSSAYEIPRSAGWVPAYPELAKIYKFYLSFDPVH